MYKILIADDEKITIESLKFIIEKNFSEIDVISTARSGREAIEKVEEAAPDIIFMDIRMPGINGLEAIREIRKKHGRIVIIVLTAFDQFDFAKEAVNLGVMEYLLKPVNRMKVIEVVNKAMGVIRAEKEKRKAELELKEKLEYVVPILENGLIYAIILFDNNSRELLNYRNIFEIRENGGFIMTVEFGDEENGGGLENKIGYSVRSQNFYPYFKDTVTSLCKCFVGPVMLNRIVVFVPDGGEKDEFSSRQAAVDNAQRLLDRLSDRLKCSFKIGIGRSYNCFDLLPASYEESLRALRFLKTGGVMHFMDILSGNSAAPAGLQQREKLLLQKVSAGDAAESVNSYNLLFDQLAGEYGLQPMKLKSKLLEVLFLINRMSWEYMGESYGNDLLEELLPMEDPDEIRRWGRSIVEKAAMSMSSGRELKTGGMAGQAKEYIRANYSKQITLEDVARDINISPQYLSKLFKEETGENFIDYLTGIRIKIAKSLLEEDKLSIKEIAHHVGYGDPNYFSRIFRKVVGVTPTEYREEVPK
jgi:two-component system response regulator YesN